MNKFELTDAILAVDSAADVYFDKIIETEGDLKELLKTSNFQDDEGEDGEGDFGPLAKSVIFKAQALEDYKETERNLKKVSEFLKTLLEK